MITLTDEQRKANDFLIDFWKSKDKKPGAYVTLGGYAGTGKTTIIDYLVEKIKKDSKGKTSIAFCAFTGKAASVLRSKLTNYDEDSDHCGTIHSLIYRPIMKGKIVIGWRRVESISRW